VWYTSFPTAHRGVSSDTCNVIRVSKQITPIVGVVYSANRRRAGYGGKSML